MTNSSRPSTGALRVAVALAAGTMLLTGCGPTSADEAASPAAATKAQALQADLQALAESGVNVSVPDSTTLTVLYGEDGGVACINAASERLITFNGVHFGSASGRRPGIVDPGAIAYDEAVLKTYCPDLLATYQATIEGWQTASTLPGS
jgi:hypothetical protein